VEAERLARSEDGSPAFSYCRFVVPLIHFIQLYQQGSFASFAPWYRASALDSRTYLVPLVLKPQCDRAPRSEDGGLEVPPRRGRSNVFTLTPPRILA
jgi:hypothetical protein